MHLNCGGLLLTGYKRKTFLSIFIQYCIQFVSFECCYLVGRSLASRELDLYKSTGKIKIKNKIKLNK
jgi:hypothetical protein